MLVFEVSMLIFDYIDRESGHLRIVETHKCNTFTVIAPPEGTVTAAPAQDLFEINPGCITVFDIFCTIACELRSLSGFCIVHIQIIVERVCGQFAIGAPRKVFSIFWSGKVFSSNGAFRFFIRCGYARFHIHDHGSGFATGIATGLHILVVVDPLADLGQCLCKLGGRIAKGLIVGHFFVLCNGPQAGACNEQAD